jgi:NAD(P)H dehydrogenase (quinone)
MTIAISGATGQLGTLVIEHLKTRVPAEHLRALARSTSKASGLGIAVKEADYNRPDTLVTALQNVQTLLLISSSEIGQRKTQHRNIIDAAKQANVKRIVYTSLLHADTSPLSVAAEHRETEHDLKLSGIPYTILRNGWYSENYTASIPAAIQAGVFIGSAGDGKISSASRADFAQAAALVLTTEGHEGATYELAGDEPYTLSQLAAEVSKQTGKPMVYKNLPQAEYAAMLAQFGLPEPFAQAIAAWDVDASQGALFDDSKTLSRLLGRPTTPLSKAVENALK